MPLFTERYAYRVVAFIVVVIFSLLCLAAPLSNPVDTWDILGYAASVKSLYGMDTLAIHASVYADYESFATANNFNQLTSDSSYRQVMYQDAAAFYQQIPFYKIRVLYVLMLTAASEIGLSIFSTMHFISGFFAAAAFLTIYFGMRHQVHSFVWIIAPLFYYYFSLELTIFERSGVDSFAFFWAAMMAVAFFRGSDWLFPLLALAVLVRTDLILYTALVFTAVIFWNREDWRKVIIWAPITLVTYFGVNHWSGNFGWATLITFVFESNMLATHPEQYSEDALTLKQYLGFVFSKHDWISNWFWVAIAISIVNLLVFLRSLLSTPLVATTTDTQLYARRLQTISAISLLYMVLHYLLFPVIYMRFFYGHCFFCALTLLATIASVIEARNDSQPLHSNQQTANR